MNEMRCELICHSYLNNLPEFGKFGLGILVQLRQRGCIHTQHIDLRDFCNAPEGSESDML